MHPFKETTIDGVKFVLIPEELHDRLVDIVQSGRNLGYPNCRDAYEFWLEFDSEIFNGL